MDSLVGTDEAVKGRCKFGGGGALCTPFRVFLGMVLIELVEFDLDGKIGG